MAAVENEHGYVAHGSLDGPELAPYPPYVQTDDDTRRWDAAYGIAEGLSRLYEDDGQPDARWVWYTTRALYNDRSLPTSGTEVQEAALEHDEEHVRELLDRLEQRAPAAAESGEQLDAYIGALADYLEGLLGDPDEWIPDDPDYEHEIAAAFIEEVAVPHVPGTFIAAKHPRARGGKWAKKFGMAHAVLQRHPKAVEAHAVAVAPAARKAAVAAKVRAVHQAHRRGIGHVQTAIANVMIGEHPLHRHIEHHEKALHGRKNVAVGVVDSVLPDPREAARGTAPNAGTPSGDSIDDVERTKEAVEKSLDAARWAHDHADVLRAAGHIAHEIARAKGLTAAADFEELVAEEAKAEGADTHGAMIAFYPSKDVQEKLAAHLPDGEPADDIHLTLVFLTADAAELEDKKEAIIEAVKEAASERGPLKGTVGGIAAFRGMPDGKLRPIIATADVVGLSEFRAELMRQLRLRQAAPEETHGFTPHLTLKYAPKGDAVPEPPEELPLDFGEVVLVWDEVRTAFPLSG